MRFLHPEYAPWLLALAVIVAACLIHARASRRFRRAAVPASLAALSRLTTWKRELVITSLAVIAFGAAVAALLRPQVVSEIETPEYAKEDLVIVLDHSASMGARDVPPSRFGRAVQEIRTFLLHKPDIIDRVGLVEFAGTSLILSHLTRDVDSLMFYLDWIRESSDVRFGTDIGAALASARELVKKDDRDTKKLFLVISDGADQGTALAKELAAVRDERTRVYAIGIGSDPNAVVPALNEEGVETLLQGEDGQALTAGFDEATLRDLAAQTGGRYVRSTTGADLRVALQDLVNRERLLVSVTRTTEYRDVYRELLMVASLASLLLMLLI